MAKKVCIFLFIFFLLPLFGGDLHAAFSEEDSEPSVLPIVGFQHQSSPDSLDDFFEERSQEKQPHRKKSRRRKEGRKKKHQDEGALVSMSRSVELPFLPFEIWEKIIIEHGGMKVAVALSSTCRRFNDQFGFLRAFVGREGHCPGNMAHQTHRLRKIFFRGGYDHPTLNFRSLFVLTLQRENFLPRALGMRPRVHELALAPVTIQNVTCLDLRDGPQTDFTLESSFFSPFIRLGTLTLDGTVLTADGATHLCEFLQGLQGLRILSLENCGLDDERVAQIVRAIHRKRVKSFNVRRNRLQTLGILGDWVSSNPQSLRRLDVSFNEIGDPAAFATGMSDALMENNHLTTLKMRGVGLQGDALQWAQKLLTERSSLEELDLRENAFDDVGFKGVWGLILENKALRRLRLGGLSLPLSDILQEREEEAVEAGQKIPPKLNELSLKTSLEPTGILRMIEKLGETNIQKLVLRGHVSKVSVSGLFDISSLKVLGVGAWTSNDQVMVDIAKGLVAHPALKILLLNAALVNPRHAFQLLEALKSELEPKDVVGMARARGKRGGRSQGAWLEDEAPEHHVSGLKTKKQRRKKKEALAVADRPSQTIVFPRNLLIHRADMNRHKPPHIFLNFLAPEEV